MQMLGVLNSISPVLLCSLTTVMAALPAFGCSCPPLGLWRFLSYEGLLPGNARGVLWQGEFSGNAGRKGELPVRIYDAAGTLQPAAFESLASQYGSYFWLVRPKGGFEPAKNYIFKFRDPYSNKEQSLKIYAGKESVKSPPAPVWLAIGSPRTAIVGMAMDGSCSENLTSMQIPIAMVIPSHLRPFRNQFFYKTLVDERPWLPDTSLCSWPKPGESWNFTKGTDILFTACLEGGHIHGLTPGKHRVKLQASLPGTDFKMVSKEMTVELHCPSH